MNNNPRFADFILVIIFMCSFVIPAFSKEPNSSLSVGKIHDSVACIKDANQRYALYLPSSYVSAQSWPVLFLFDPGARGKLPVIAFQRGAERYGYILIGSNNSRNGPSQPVVAAMRALWKDVSTRFTIDLNRVYAGGFSGGSRVSTYFNKVIGHPVEGIIACGAGLGSGIKLSDLKAQYYLGLIGISDFNYDEMKRLDLEMDRSGNDHFIRYFKGNHRWPEPALCQFALEWMEIAAIAKGLRLRTPKLLNEIYRRWDKDAKALLNGEVPFFELNLIQGMICRFKSLKDVGALENRVKQIISGNVYKLFEKKERRRMRESADYPRQIAMWLDHIRQTPASQINMAKLKAGLRLNYLFKKRENEKNPFEHAMGTRLLFGLSDLFFSKGRQLLRSGDIKRAKVLFEILLISGEYTVFKGWAHYYLGVCYSSEKRTKKALFHVKSAIKSGINRMNLYGKNDNFNHISKHPDFLALIRTLK